MSVTKQIERKLKTISITCPICKLKKEVRIPLSALNNNRQLTTVSIPRRTICKHHFQLFIDKNFTIRGYQKVDFEVNNEDNNLNKMSLEEIYEEFWEFIDDKDIKFESFILKDNRRKNASKKKELITREIIIENIHNSPI